jgi:hypothetical protein
VLASRGREAHFSNKKLIKLSRSKTCLTFEYEPYIPDDSSSLDLIVFTRGADGQCESFLGKKGGTQYILLGEGCSEVYNYICCINI